MKKRKYDSKLNKPDFFSRQVSEASRFYLDLNPPRSARLAVVSGGCEHCRPGYVIDRADFPFYSIEYVARGEGSVVLKGKKIKLSPGVMFSYGPKIPHLIRTSGKNPLVKYFVDFTGTGAKALLSHTAFSLGGTAHTIAPNEVVAILDDLIRNGLKGSAYSSELCSLLLQQLILKIRETAVAANSVNSLAFETYHRCRQFIEKHVLELQTLDQVAAECHIDKAYLCRLFRRFEHSSPYQVLLRLKINIAAERLQKPGTLIKNVSDELGFSDPFHFSRSFRNVFGVSPRQFLTLHQR